ncbi:MAG: ribosomal-processing cysteine protease Prp [Oscillospiraceae bacterium]|nr:ribosomal-processing cysteine protease Prp [Oscillospiraceae bacterium]
MIEVKLSSDKDFYTLEISGHAGYAESNDIVCAGVSAVAFSLLGYILSLSPEVSGLNYTAESGYFKLEAGGGDFVKAAFGMAGTGIAQICGSYPQNVKISLR